jgi:hypothetical protein
VQDLQNFHLLGVNSFDD